MPCERLTQSPGIFRRDTRLWSTVPQADRLWQPLAHVVELILVAGVCQLAAGHDLHAIAGAHVIDDRGRVRQGQGVLDVEICLSGKLAPVVVVDRFDSGFRGCCVGAKLSQELPQIY